MLFLPLALIPFILGIYDLYRSTKVEKIPEKREAPKKEESETGKVKEIVYMRCPKCKAKNEEDAKYCKKCGNKL
jgi:ribosomal protein L40E